MSIHYRAMQHLDRAKTLLDLQGDEDLIYAALEMRFCIENVFYNLATAYKRELPDTVLDGKTWQPGEIIDMLVDIDPYVETGRVLSMGFEPSPGAEPREMHVIGRQSGASRKLVSRYYHALGFFLHARTDQRSHDFVKLRRKLAHLLPHLEKFRSDTVLDGFATRVSLKCPLCGRPIAKRAEAAARDPYLTCPNSRCGAMFECMETDDQEGSARFRLVERQITCKSCKTKLFFPLHFLIEGSEIGARIRCKPCGAVAQLARFIDTIPLDAEGGGPAEIKDSTEGTGEDSTAHE